MRNLEDMSVPFLSFSPSTRADLPAFKVLIPNAGGLLHVYTLLYEVYKVWPAPQYHVIPLHSFSINCDKTSKECDSFAPTTRTLRNILEYVYILYRKSLGNDFADCRNRRRGTNCEKSDGFDWSARLYLSRDCEGKVHIST